MEFIAGTLGAFLGFIMYICYGLTGSYGVSLILFTFISRVILFPVSYFAYKNAIRLAKLKPKLDDIKRYYSGDKERIAQIQLDLYKTERYNPFLDLVPLFIQLLFIIGLIQVMYNPMDYLPIEASDMAFLGIDLGAVPTLSVSALFLVPVFSGVSSLVLCLVQNKIHISQKSQGAGAKLGSTAFFTAFASYIAFIVPAGVGIYWGFGNLFTILCLFLLNRIFAGQLPPVIQRPPREKPDKAVTAANREREKADYKRFAETQGKELVFYAMRSGVYKYFKSVLEYITENSDITVHYVTSDPKDALFAQSSPRVIPYYIGERRLISLMINLDTRIMVMTTPDLQKYHIKRSVVRKDIEYIYMFHAFSSVHLTLREGAVDHYDTIFLTGPHLIKEIRRTEEIYELPEKKLVECGYGLADDLIAAYSSVPRAQKEKPVIMIAPSWQADNILDTCIYEMIERLAGTGCSILVRPHPEFIKRFPDKTAALLEKAAGYPGGGIEIQTDFSSNASIYESDIMITDWSNIAFEFSCTTKRPTVFINTPMKVQNPNYDLIGIEPMEIVYRREIGVPVDLDGLDKLPGIVSGILANPNEWEERINVFMEKHLYNPGKSGETGGRYIIEALRGE